MLILISNFLNFILFQAVDMMRKLRFKALHQRSTSQRLPEGGERETRTHLHMPCYAEALPTDRQTKGRFSRCCLDPLKKMLSKLTARWGIILANFYDPTRARSHLLFHRGSSNIAEIKRWREIIYCD
jgi:hypothetical protein